MSDLFHPDLSDEDIGLVWVVMASCLPQHREVLFRRTPADHRFNVLTKRPERMAEWLRRRWASREWRRSLIARIQNQIPGLRVMPVEFLEALPDVLPNVWLGTSIEDQVSAVQRLPSLMGCPAEHRFVAYEPALDEVDLSRWLFDRQRLIHELIVGPARMTREDAEETAPPTLDLVIAGGEQGYRDSREVEAEWFYRVADQARDAKVMFHLRQVGYALAREFKCERPWGEDPEEWPPTFIERLAGDGDPAAGDVFAPEESGI